MLTILASTPHTHSECSMLTRNLQATVSGMRIKVLERDYAERFFLRAYLVFSFTLGMQGTLR